MISSQPGEVLTAGCRLGPAPRPQFPRLRGPQPGQPRPGPGRPARPGLTRQFLVAAVEVLQRANHAESTKKTRKSQLRAYTEFTGEMGIAHFPPTAEEVVLYASWLMFTKCSKADSLLQYLSALRTYCSSKGAWIPSPSEYGPLRCLVNGTRRLFPGPTRRSKPVTPTILTGLVLSRPPEAASWRQSVTLQVFRDCSLLLFFTMLRSSNLFPPHPAAASPVRNLTWDKVRLVPGGVVITVLLSKTEQFREKVHEISLTAKPGSIFCPVAALFRLRDIRGPGVAAPTDHVLMLPQAGISWRPLVKYEYLEWFRGRVRAMGFNPDDYLLHGFRHGGISWGLLNQTNVTLVQLQSGHMSSGSLSHARCPRQSPQAGTATPNWSTVTRED